MYDFFVSEHLERKLKKLSKKDRDIYNQVLKKIDVIIHTEKIDRFKNLRHDKKDIKRVHIGSFVLIFQYRKKENVIFFDDFDHHDTIYK